MKIAKQILLSSILCQSLGSTFACNLVKNKNKASLEATESVVASSADVETEAVQPSEVVVEKESEAASSEVVAPLALSPLPQTLKELGFFEDTKNFQVKSSLVPYDVEAPLWSDAAIKFRYVKIPEGKNLEFDPETKRFIFPSGSYLIKHFDAKADGSAPMETRVMLQLEDKSWAFASYQWDEAGGSKRVTEVTKLDAASNWPQGYRIPSEEECVKCHKNIPSEVLGFQPAQIVNSVANLLAAKVLTESVAKTVAALSPKPSANDKSLSIEERALAYLDVNCGTCHRLGGSNSYLQLDREKIDLAWLVKKSYIVPGKPEESTLWKRFNAESNRMPQVSLVKDPLGLELLRLWITDWGKATAEVP